MGDTYNSKESLVCTIVNKTCSVSSRLQKRKRLKIFHLDILKKRIKMIDVESFLRRVSALS